MPFTKGHKINLGKKYSKERCQRISEGLTGRNLSLEHKEKLRIAKIGNTIHLGYRNSDEVKEKMAKVHTKKYYEVNSRTKHRKIEQKLGKPKYCEHCKRTDKKRYDWANKDHKYSEKIEDWIRLCRSCHIQYDIKFNNKQNGRKTQNTICK